MSLVDDVSALQHYLEELGQIPDEKLEARYAMQKPRRPSGFYWQLRWLAGRVLRSLVSLGILRSDPWPVRLRHAGKGRRAKPLLVWAVGVDQDALRKACHGLSELLDSLPGYAPVLVTDVADFAFFSRLAWLVEYVPRVEGIGEPFEARKERFLARLYQGAPAIPIGIGLAPEPALEAIRGRILRHSLT